MLSGYWKNKLEEEKNLESLQNLYKDEVMKYRLRKAVGEQYYSTIFQPITGKLEETIEPLKQLKELSEEQSKRILEPPPVPLALPEGIRGHEGERQGPIVSEIEEEDDEFKDVPEPEESAVGGVKEHRGPELDIEDIRKHGFKPPSEYEGLEIKDFNKAIWEIGTTKAGITNKNKELDKELENLQGEFSENTTIVGRYRVTMKITEKEAEKKKDSEKKL